MKMAISILFVILISYIVGSFNLAYILSKIKGYDIRQHGSGNAGASNVVIMMGKKSGLIVAVVDIMKAFIVCAITTKIFPDKPYMGAIAGSSAIIGHIFPFYMNFKGGKGLATLGGTILALDPKMFVVLLTISIVLALLTNYICVVPMSMSIIFSVAYGVTKHSLSSFFILISAAIIINIRHMENLRRIREGTEARFSLLWNRKAESERLGKIYDDGKGYEKVEELD